MQYRRDVQSNAILLTKFYVVEGAQRRSKESVGVRVRPGGTSQGRQTGETCKKRYTVILKCVSIQLSAFLRIVAYLCG